ncbi:MAG: hypothetical protein IKW03_04870 [Clostridia bacterium]|nr:hypothetical protein [Clostridia bacterium]
MKKSEIARQFDFNATSFLLIASFALTVNSVLNIFVSNLNVNAVVNVILAVLVSASSILSYIMIFRGFIFVDKSCRLSEENQNYYMGRKLTMLTAGCIVTNFLFTIIAVFMSFLLSQYEQLPVLTPADETARMNIMIITAIINIIIQIASLSTPFIVYLWKLRASIPAKDKLSNIALLTVIIMVVQLVIGIMNSTYIAQNSHSTFLTTFSEILLIVKYVVLCVFLMLRRKNLIASVPDEE